MGVICNTGLNRLVQIGLGKSPQVLMTARLFVNNIAPSFTSTLATFIECSNAGYAAQALTAANWAGSTTGGFANYSYPTLDFTFTVDAGPQTVYGYFLENTTNGELLWAGRLASPFVIPSGGGTLSLNINYVDQSIPV